MTTVMPMMSARVFSGASAPVVLPTQTFTFSDDFNSGVANDPIYLRNGWSWSSATTTYRSSFKVSPTNAGKVYINAAGFNLLLVETSDPAHKVSTDVLSSSSGIAPLVFRAVNYLNFLYLKMTVGTGTGAVALRKVVAGVDTLVGSISLSNFTLGWGVMADCRTDPTKVTIYVDKHDGNGWVVFKTNLATSSINLPADAFVATATKIGFGSVATVSAVDPAFDQFSAESAYVLPATYAITIAEQTATPGRVFAVGYGATSRSITISGAFSGAATSIEYRLKSTLTGLSIAGHGWQTLVGSPTGSSYSAAITVDCAEYVVAETRIGNAPSYSAAQANAWGVGYVVAVDGQSQTNFLSYFSGAETTGLVAGANTRRMEAGAYITPTDQGEIAFLNELYTILGRPVTMSNPATSSVTIASRLNTTASAITALGGDANAAVMSIGTTDARNATNEATYLSDQAAWYAATRAATPRSAAQFPGIIGVEGKSNGDSGQTDAGVNTVRKAQRDGVTAVTGMVLGYFRMDFGLVDSVHYNEAGRIEMGRRMARAVGSALGVSATNARGPAINTASWTGSTITIVPTLNGSSALTVPAVPTGFTVLSNGTPVAVTGGAYTAGNIVLTMASGLTAPVTLEYLTNKEPVVTSLITGDIRASASSPGFLPLQPTNGAVAVAA